MLCFRRLFYDGATTQVDKEIMDKIEYGGPISENAQLAQAIGGSAVFLLTNG